MSDDAERTLDPTDQRKEQFRKEGRFAKARDAGGVAATFAVVLVLTASATTSGEAIREMFAHTLGDLGALERTGPAAVLGSAFRAIVTLAGPPVAAATFAASLVGIVQAGFHPYTDLLGIKFERLDPSGAIGKMFSPKRAASETVVAVLRLVAVGLVAWRALVLELPKLSVLSRIPLAAGLPVLLGAVERVVVMSTFALFVVALADYAQSYWTLSREMMMTRKERTDESRQQDGDPKAKARMKARARAMAKKRALSNVKDADVIVTNPTHVAVALRYGPKDPAPVVVAKGHDEMALLIRAQGRKYGVPILENRRLARALDAEVSLGRPVPPAHFAAVARVLAFVYKRGRKRRAAQTTGTARAPR